MTLLDGALIVLVLLLLIGAMVVVARMLADEDGARHPDSPWPRWTRRGRNHHEGEAP
jgi:hypothetical protein